MARAGLAAGPLLALLLGVAYAASIDGLGTIVGTPPNAIVFGAGLVRLPQMIKAGSCLNIAGIVPISVITYLLIVPLILAGR